jgi:hypothetical protein
VAKNIRRQLRERFGGEWFSTPSEAASTVDISVSLGWVWPEYGGGITLDDEPMLMFNFASVAA